MTAQVIELRPITEGSEDQFPGKSRIAAIERSRLTIQEIGRVGALLHAP